MRKELLAVIVIILVLVGLVWWANNKPIVLPWPMPSPITSASPLPSGWPQPSSTPLPPPADWQLIENQVFNYTIRIPKTWKQKLHASSTYTVNIFDATDGSSLQILTEKNPRSETLEQYLKKLDGEQQTGWEGKPNAKTISENKTVLLGHPAIVRLQFLSAAGFETQSEYALMGSTFFTFTALPNADKKVSQTEAGKYFDQILSTVVLK